MSLRTAAVIVAIGAGALFVVARTDRTTPAQRLGVAGPGAAREPLSSSDTERVQALITIYVAGMVRDAPVLAGMRAASISPVYDEQLPRPIGGMVRLELPDVVASVTIDLVRSRNGVPEPVESEITNLRGLDAIVLFDTAAVVSVSIAPLPGDVTDPAAATRARPVDPATHQDPTFGDTD